MEKQAASSEVELPPRPHVVQPTEVAMIELDGAALEVMSAEEIASWAWHNLGVAFDPSWPKSKMLDQLVRKFATEVLALD